MSQEILIVGLLLGLSVLPVQAAESQFTLATGVGYNFFKLTEINHHLQARNNYLNNDLIKGPASPLANLIPKWAITTFQPLKGGMSHWGRELFWFTPYLAGGGEIKQAALISVYKAADSLNTYYREKYKVKLTGMSGLIVYRPRWLNPSLKPPLARTLKERIRLDFILGLGRYYSKFKRQLKINVSDLLHQPGAKTDRETVYDGWEWGGKVGLELGILLQNSLTINWSLNYRYLVFDRLIDRQGDSYNSRYSADMAPEEFDFSGATVRSSVVWKF